LNKDRNRRETIDGLHKFRSLLEHYYPNGETLRAEVGQEKEGNQRITDEVQIGIVPLHL